MTCIVGLIDNDKIWMGADSAGVAGYQLTTRKDTKVFKNNGFLIGYTSSFRMGQLLRFKFKPPEFRPDKKDIYEFMVTDFIDDIRSCFKSGGYAEKNNEAEKGGCFLVGYKSRLFQIESDYQVGESIHNFNAVGCGDSLALGSLFSTKDKYPRDRIKLALESAQEFNAGVRKPFIIESI